MFTLSMFKGGVIIAVRYLDAEPTSKEVGEVMAIRCADGAEVLEGLVTIAAYGSRV